MMLNRGYLLLKSPRLFGSAISIHWSVFVVLLLLSFPVFNSPIYATVTIVSYLSVIFIHELGHLIVAKLHNLQVFNLKFGAFHGICEYEFPDNAWEDVLISWGGIIAQLVVGISVLVSAYLFGNSNLGYWGPMVIFLGYYNLFIAIVNLTPTPGLDGYKAWKIVPLYISRIKARKTTKSILRNYMNKK